MNLIRPLVYAAALSALSAPWAFAADIRIEEIRARQGDTHVAFYNVKATGSSLTEAEWRAALSTDEFSKTSAALAKLNASRLTIDKVEIESRSGDTKSRMALTNLDFANIANGRAASGSAGRGAIRTESGKQRDTTGFEKITLRNAALALPPKQADGTLPLALEEAVIETITSESGKGSASAIGALWIENIRAAALDDKVLTVLGMIAGRDFDDLSALEKSAGAKAFTEVYNAFALGRIVAEDIASRNGNERTTVKRMAMEGGLKPNFTMEGIEVRTGNESTRIGSFRLEDFSIEPTIKALLKSLGDASGKEPPIGELLPRLGSIVIADASASGSKVSAYGGESAMKVFRIDFNNPLGGIPTGIRVSFDGLAGALDPNDPSAAELLALGYKKLEAGGAIDIDVDKARDTLNFREVSLRIKDFGTLHLTGSVAKIGELIEAKDSDEAALAVMNLTIRTLGVGLANEGLFERVLSKTAKETGKTPEQVKREIASLAVLGLPGLIGTSPQAQAIVEASTRFLAKPERIVFAFRSKSPDGIGLSDMMGIATPDDFFAVTDVTIQAGP